MTLKIRLDRILKGPFFSADGAMGGPMPKVSSHKRRSCHYSIEVVGAADESHWHSTVKTRCQPHAHQAQMKFVIQNCR